MMQLMISVKINSFVPLLVSFADTNTDSNPNINPNTTQHFSIFLIILANLISIMLVAARFRIPKFAVILSLSKKDRNEIKISKKISQGHFFITFKASLIVLIYK